MSWKQKPNESNLALGRPAVQSGVTDGGLASRAVDGNIDGDFAAGSVSQTLQTRTPLWEVDLGSVQAIGDIQIFPRTDGGLNSGLQNYWVLVSETPFSSGNLDAARSDPGVWMFHGSEMADGAEAIKVNTTGRYVRIQLASQDDVLSLAEVRVMQAEATASFLVGNGAVYDNAFNEYTLTTAEGFDTGRVMSADRIDLRSDFQLSFDVFLGTDDAGADGLAFVLHNSPEGAAAIGAVGSGMGYAGIQDGLAIEFDTWANPIGAIISGGADLSNDHTGFVDTDGSFGTAPFDLGNVEDGQWHSVQVNWNALAQTLTYSFDGALAGELNSDLATEFLGGSHFAHFGFTAATGGGNNEHKVRINSISATYNSTDNEYTLTTAEGFDTGRVMSADRIDLRSDFQLSFDVFLGTDDAGADGLAFVLHNSPEGAAAIGAVGSGMGYAGIQDGLAIEFDTWANPIGAIISGGADLSNDHTGFVDTDGSFGTAPFDLGNVEDGQWHSVQVNWNALAQTLTYSFDGALAGELNSDLATEFLGGSHFAHFGFTAATGGGNNEHKVRVTELSATFEVGAYGLTDITRGDATDNIIISVDQSASNPGQGELDVHVGGAGSDIFVLGDDEKVYYDDTISSSAGFEDYVLIWDFESGIDQIQLVGSASDYRLEAAPSGLPSGTAIYALNPSGPDELIGIVNDISGLTLNSADFAYDGLVI